MMDLTEVVLMGSLCTFVLLGLFGAIMAISLSPDNLGSLGSKGYKTGQDSVSSSSSNYQIKAAWICCQLRFVLRMISDVQFHLSGSSNTIRTQVQKTGLSSLVQ